MTMEKDDTETASKRHDLNIYDGIAVAEFYKIFKKVEKFKNYAAFAKAFGRNDVKA